jgi:protein-tyrosine phosphatase
MADIVFIRPEGGSLSQGSIKDVIALSCQPHTVTTVVLCAIEDQPKVYTKNPSPLTVIRVPFDDNPGFSDLELLRVFDQTFQISQDLAKRVNLGENVMVTCHAGLNRSGLVSGLTLILLGFSAEQSIEAIRKARGPYALNNHAFVGLLKAFERSRTS